MAIAGEVTILRLAGAALNQPPLRIDADSCIVTRRGDVLLPHAADAEQPHADVQLLRALLAGREMPSDLEQVVYGPPPPHLGDALGMFARPDRRADIAAVALRGLAADAELQRALSAATPGSPPAAAANPPAADDDISQLRAQVAQRPATLPKPTPPAPSASGVGRSGRLQAVAAAVLVVGAIAVGYWATARRAVPSAAAPPEAAALPSADPNGWWRLAGSREADIDLGRDRARRRVLPAIDGGPTSSSGVRAASTPADAPAMSSTGAPAPVEPAEAVPSGSMAEPKPAVPVDSVYSWRSAGVDPPLMMYPRMPESAFPAADAAVDGQYVEVLVDESGNVEAVRLRGRPRPGEPSYHYSMILAAAKAWQFEPARLAGRPVRYVTRVVLAP